MHPRFDLISQYAAKLILLFALIQTSATASETEQIHAHEILPSEVYVQVSKVRAELELLRIHMGKPKANPSALVVRNAAPREVFYQAMTLFDKSDQFSFDQIRARGERPDTPENSIRPGDVFNVVNQVLARIREVKVKLNITTSIENSEHDPSRTPTDVFLAIVQANRQLNLLLDQRFAPKDVYMQVSRAIGYSARLLAHFANTQRIPDPEGLQQNKLPIDVYRRLARCYERIRVIGEKSKLPMLYLETDIAGSVIAPSDVYDIAAVVVSELAYLHTKLAYASPPRPVFDPGRKFPSHVFQRVSILESQLEMLSAETIKSPLWLSTNQATQ